MALYDLFLEVSHSLQRHAQTCVCLIALSFLILLHLNGRSKHRLPPGPPCLPIIGNLHLLGSLPHRSLWRLSNAYGPLMHLQLGRVPALIVSSPSAAKEVLRTHDLAFCTRPFLTTAHKLTYGGVDLVFAPFSNYWMQMKKMSTSEFFSSRKVQLLRPVREEEVSLLVRSVARDSVDGAAVNLSDMLLCLLSNVTCRAVFGKRFSPEGECRKSEFDELIKDMIRLLGGFVAGDFYPSMHRFLNVVTGVQKSLEKTFREMDEFLEEEVEERERDGAKGGHDFASVLVRLQRDGKFEFPLTRDHIKATLVSSLLAGSDTAATSIIWTMTELIRHPAAMAKAQEEVRRVAGGKGKVEESDLPDLKYLSAVVKETLRLHPPAPLIVRESRKDCEISGYRIPARTRCYINVLAIGRDSNTWKNPEDFIPERFEDRDIDYKGNHFELVSFGSGRRICSGLLMAAAVVELTLANLLYSFNWTLPEGMTGEDVDMDEYFGLIVHKKVPLKLVAFPV